MKKFWRCFVCNDIHYGTSPPEICPTCQAKNAYVEVSSTEAQTISRITETEMDREQFLASITRFAEKNEFQINPDRERVSTLLEGIFENEKNHGLKYCPCRLITKNFAEDLKLVCPCNFLIHETYKNRESGECWCGLFVRRKTHG
ncbi:MAG: ferredoxin-thioredoxin reductase catalytic domain-containing protein [Candidatus Aminicenantales bacterium]